MKLCVGATSRRVVEVAAQERVHQIVASRRQVDVQRGYTGLNQHELVHLVRGLSDGQTEVVRDHGGPLQGQIEDDGIASLRADVYAGFNSLHLDVCKIPHGVQFEELLPLVNEFAPQVPIELGGEHEEHRWNESLVAEIIDATGYKPRYGVVGAGTKAWNDRQYGSPILPEIIHHLIEPWQRSGIKTKMHNADWIGNRSAYADIIDAYNLAPEIAQVEVNELLTVLPMKNAVRLLEYAYDSEMWRHWFNGSEGTWDERARCAVRYVLNDRPVLEIVRLDPDAEHRVRTAIRNAIRRGH